MAAGKKGTNLGDGVRRPLLTKGELLGGTAKRSGRLPGEKFHPASIDDAHRALAPLAVEMGAAVEAMSSALRGRHVVFEATLHPNYLASSWFPLRLLESAGLQFVGARRALAPHSTPTRERLDQPTKTLLLAGSPRQVADFAGLVAAEPTDAASWEEIRRFRDLGLPKAHRILLRRPDLGAGEVITWEAVLTHACDVPENEQTWADETFAKLVAFIERLGGHVDVGFRRDIEHLTFVPIVMSGEAADEAATFNALRAIRPMPHIRPLPNATLRATPTRLKPSNAALEARLPDVTVTAFDGGVNAQLPVFAPFVTARDLTPEPADAACVRHGSIVTGALLYGPLAQATVQLPDPWCRVVHNRVLPVPAAALHASDSGIYWVLDQVERDIRANKPKLVSFSIGPDECVEDDGEPSRWTTTMDSLVKEYDITMVAAVGNNGEEDQTLGYNRVQAPGDMVNGVCVGACTSATGTALRAPYSACGPGREGQRIQPTGVAFGGSAAEPFLGIDANGRMAQTAGTSFAGPVVARSLAGLHGMLDAERARPEVSRAFAAHYATRASSHSLLELGFGRIPAAFDGAFECSPHEVTVLYEDALPRGRTVAMRLPIPPGLPGDAWLELRWTLCFVSSVDARDPVDYTQSGVDLIFRPNTMLTNVTFADGHVEELHRGRDATRIAAALAGGGRDAENGPSLSGWRTFRREGRQRVEGRWETLISGKRRLRARALDIPSLDVMHLHRIAGQLVADDVEPLRVAMLATITAGNRNYPIYDRVAAQYQVLVPVVRTPIRILSVA